MQLQQLSQMSDMQVVQNETVMIQYRIVDDLHYMFKMTEEELEAAIRQHDAYSVRQVVIKQREIS